MEDTPPPENKRESTMWNRNKREEEPTPPSNYNTTTRGSGMEGVPVQTSPYSSASQSSGVATIGKGVRVKGQISSEEDLIVDGQVEGTLDLPQSRLTIGQNGRLKADIHAKSVVVRGQILGNVVATDKLEIRAEGRLTGNVSTHRIVVEDGAFFKGQIDIIKVEEPAPEPAEAARALGASAGE
jgi:cytoskeletal protein CcmA (bactofilin family)